MWKKYDKKNHEEKKTGRERVRKPVLVGRYLQRVFLEKQRNDLSNSQPKQRNLRPIDLVK